MAQNKRSSYIIEIFTSTARDKYFYPSVFFFTEINPVRAQGSDLY